mgnify:CR=1 FL=1
MNTHSLCCIGYITQDKVVTPKNTIYMPGGTSFYFAHAIKHLNANDFLLVTALADTEMGRRTRPTSQRPMDYPQR